MNLKEYKETKAKQAYKPGEQIISRPEGFRYPDGMTGDVETYPLTQGAFENGFNAAIELQLPIKFAEWFGSKELSWKTWMRNHYLLDDIKLREEAYKFWLENILKLE